MPPVLSVAQSLPALEVTSPLPPQMFVEDEYILLHAHHFQNCHCLLIFPVSPSVMLILWGIPHTQRQLPLSHSMPKMPPNIRQMLKRQALEACLFGMFWSLVNALSR